MKTLYLMRHAKSSWKSPKLDDFERPLNKRGLRDAPRMGELIREQGLVPDAVIPAAPGFQTPFAAEIRRQVGIATGAVGLITSAVQAEQIIATDCADVVLLARELLRDPYWPIHAAAELKVDYPWPVQYERAKT
mgnify:CR=1 FL=1